MYSETVLYYWGFSSRLQAYGAQGFQGKAAGGPQGHLGLENRALPHMADPKIAR